MLTASKTLRDLFPIYCQHCQQPITDDDYFIIDIISDRNRIPTCVYAHRTNCQTTTNIVSTVV